MHDHSTACMPTCACLQADRTEYNTYSAETCRGAVSFKRALFFISHDREPSLVVSVYARSYCLRAPLCICMMCLTKHTMVLIQQHLSGAAAQDDLLQRKVLQRSVESAPSYPQERPASSLCGRDRCSGRLRGACAIASDVDYCCLCICASC